MEKTTRENVENEYKEAIRAKYRKEKEGAEYYDFLAVPGQASLRDLCWKIFRSNPKYDDLKVYLDFFKFEFDPKEENTSTTYTDKFRKVGTFYKEGKKPAKRSTIELAAILVDFEPRPFNKFKERGLFLIEEPIRNPETPFVFGINDQREEEIEKHRNETEKKKGNYQEEQIANFDNDRKINFIDEKDGGIGNERGDFKPQISNLDEEEKEKEKTISNIPEQERLSLFKKIKEKILNNFLNRLRNTVIATIFIFGLIITVIYFAFFKNHCMQWSEDHYETVDCSLKNGKNMNEIIPLEKDLLDFRKLKTCDTTICFKKNGEAFVWYAKTQNGIDFFNDNGNGRHPESKNSLRPVSQYIFEKYIRGKSCE